MLTQTKDFKQDDLVCNCGEKIYIVGSQDGFFPPFGRHSKNEMGGVWCHPFKVLDGYYLSLDGKIDKAQNVTVDEKEVSFTYENYIRKDFVPHLDKAFIISYSLLEKQKNVSFITISELVCAWLYEEIGIKRGIDNVEVYNDKIVIQNSENKYTVVIKSNKDFTVSTPDSKKIPDRIITDGSMISLDYGNLEAGELEIYFGIHDSDIDIAEKNCDNMRNKTSLVSEKLEAINNFSNNSKFTSSNKRLDNLFEITKLNTFWLIKDIDGVGRSIAAGIPDYPWFFGCDSTYSLPAILSIGQFELAKSTLETIYRVSKETNSNGRIVHEILSNGYVPNKGNTQETPHFIVALHHYLNWTGDIEFARELYPFCRMSMDWLLNEKDQDGDLFPEGYGIMEVAGLNAELIDTAVYTAKSLKCLSEIAYLLEDFSNSDRYRTLSAQCEENIQDRFFMENEKMYADVICTPRQLLGAFDKYYARQDSFLGEKSHRLAVLDRLKKELENENEATKDIEKAYSIFKNWVILTPLETKIARNEDAHEILNKFGTPAFVNEYGLYIESLGRNITMTISTAILAICYGRYGRVDEMVETILKLDKCIGYEMPLAVSELSPEGGCVIQEWTLALTAIPIVQEIAGIQPDALTNTIHLNPKLGNSLNQFELKKVRFGENNYFNMKFSDNKLFVESIEEINFVVPNDIDFEYTIIEK